MRELLPRVYTVASDLRRKVFIIDEVQRIKEGWDVLLKTLEEPPPGVLFIFCTTDPSQIRPAVVSRLQRFTFRPLTVEEIAGKLERILAAEDRTADPDAVALVARLAAGGMRDAESILDQVLGGLDERVTAVAVRDLLGLPEEAVIDRFIDALARGDALAGIEILDGLEAEGRDLVAFAEQVVVALRVRLVEGLATGSSGGSSPVQLARAARRLTGIDASRSGLGGYRWQLELALLAAATMPATTIGAATGSATAGPESIGASVGASAPTPVPVTGPRPSVPPVATQPSEPAAASVHVPVATLSSAPGTAPAEEVLAQLRARWPEVVAYVSRNPANKPIIAACRPVEIRDGIVILGFPEDQPFLREKAESRRTALEDGLAAVLGRSVGVRCVVANVELVDAAPSGDDDLVSQAIRIFDGELADVREVS
jgi:DNA polymerase-3 subunit gamma/tau